ncbi:MAG TPA: hypothetical protein VFK41_04750 [Nocardioidaceae bacterium]|nr:hypothetical protein [Nocardioidaceae bacterium]
MNRLKKVLSPLFVACMLVMAVDYASYAATGSSLLLGRSNSTPDLTTVTRTKSGPALSVRTKTKKNAPFVVNGRGRVANLNADMLDGLHASSLGSRAIRFELPSDDPASQISEDLPFQPGTYLITYNALINTSAATAGCFVRVSDAVPYRAQAFAPTDGDGDVYLSGADIIVVDSSSDVRLVCTAVGPFNVNLQSNSSVKSSVNALRLSSVTTQVLP